MNSRLVARTLVAVTAGLATMALISLLVVIINLLGGRAIGVVVIGVAVAIGVWLADWYTDRTSP